MARFKPAELELNCENMEQLKITGYIGKGFWREVFKAKWNGTTTRFVVFGNGSFIHDLTSKYADYRLFGGVMV